MNNQQAIDLINTTLKDLPNLMCSEINFKLLHELWGHPIITLIKSKQKIPIDLKIYYGVPTTWILEWKRKWD